MLTDAPLVMVWRRVAELAETKRLVEETMAWPSPDAGPGGEDPDVVMFDAGGALVGFALQRELADGRSCSVIDRVGIDMVINPASQLLLAPADLDDSVRRLSAKHPIATAALTAAAAFQAAGVARDSLPFFDGSGNQLAFERAGSSRLRGTAGGKIEGVRARGGAPIVGVELTVSDLRRSRQFYERILELRPLELTETGVSYEVGTMLLRLQPEPIAGLVGLVSKSGRLAADLHVFRVDDLDRTTQGLSKRGVSFPAGVEEWDDGRQAYFSDPDGHLLSVWEPAARPSNIDFHPALKRIVADVAR